MTDTITLPRSVVEQAISTIVELEYSNSTAVSDKMARDTKAALRAALEEPQGEQAPVAWLWVNKQTGAKGVCFEIPTAFHPDYLWRQLYTRQQPKRERLPVGVELFIHPQNLRCKSNQARLATLWGYVKPQPKREPLIGEAECQCPYPKSNPSTYNAWLDGWEAAERTHGIGGEV